MRYGKAQRIPVTGAPAGAFLVVDGKKAGTLPMTLRLIRNKEHVVRVEKEGYNPVVIEIGRERRPGTTWTVVDDVISGILVGAAAGALFAEGILHSTSHDDYSTLSLGIALGGIITPYALVGADRASGSLSVLEPATVTVTLTKREGPPREERIRLSADRLPEIRWIRVALEDRKPGP